FLPNKPVGNAASLKFPLLMVSDEFSMKFCARAGIAAATNESSTNPRVFAICTSAARHRQKTGQGTNSGTEAPELQGVGTPDHLPFSQEHSGNCRVYMLDLPSS